MQEEWRSVARYKGIYEVSNLGCVRSLDRVTAAKNHYGTPYSRHVKGRILSITKSSDGYCEVALKSTLYRVHRLVAEAFLDTWDPNLEVNHKDGNKENNCVSNLEMVTHQQNMDHYWRSDAFAEHQKKYAEYARDAMTARWQDSEFRNKVQSKFNDPEYKKAHSAAGKKVYSDPEMRKRASEHSKKMWSSCEFHDKQVAAIKNGWSDSTKRKAVSERIQRLVWLTAPDGSYYRCPQCDVDIKLSEGYVLGRKGSNKVGGKIKIHCGKNNKTYSSMTECETDLGLKYGDVYHIVRNSMPKRLIPVQMDLQLSIVNE